MSYIKEPSYFTDGWPNWATSLPMYEALFAGTADRKAIGEASPCYVYDPLSPERIREQLGTETKVIVSVRNPVDRAYSHWAHERYRFGRDALSFMEAIDAEPERGHCPQAINRRYFFHGMYRYFWGSEYADKIRCYIQTFGRDNVKVLVFEEWCHAPLETYSEICRFLDIGEFRPTNVNSNVATIPRVGSLSRMMSRLNQSPLFSRFYGRLPPRLRRWLFLSGSKLFWANQKPRNSLKPLPYETFQALMNRFEPSILDLESLLGRELNVWRIAKTPLATHSPKNS